VKLRSLTLCWIFVHALGAAGPDWKLSQLNRKVWQIEDGLPHNYVAAISTDENGYLLLGTSSGIARFDGLHFTALKPLSGMRIYTLLRTADGAYWAGESNALYKLADGRIQTRFDTGGPLGIVHALLEDRRHRLWAVSPKGLQRVDSKGPVLVVPGNNVDGYKAQPVAEDDSGAIWFAAQEGLFRGDVEWNNVGLRHIQGKPVSVFNHGGLYLGTTTGFYSLKCARNECEGSAVPEVIGPVTDTLSARDGSLWIATWGSGIYRLTNNQVEHISTLQGLADDFVRILSEDRERNIWAGTRSGGLTRFRQTTLKPFGIPEGLGGNYASAVIGDGAGGLWLGTWRSGLFHWNNGTMAAQPLPQQPLGLLISALGTDAGHNLWIGSYQGLWRIRERSRTAERVPLENDKITSLLVTRDHSLWLASERLGLRQFPSGSPLDSKPLQFLAGESVSALLEDSRDRTVWIGTKAGLWRMNPDRQVERLGRAWITAIAQDSRNRVWVASDDGKIQVFTKTGPVAFIYSGLAPQPVYAIATDTHNAVWLGTGHGIGRASNEDVEEFLAGRKTSVELVNYGASEGMRTIEVRSGAQPSTWKREDGTVWLPTARGFVEIDKAPPEYNDTPPRTYIEDLRLDGKAIASKKPFRLEPGDHELVASFTAIRLSRGERVQFRYKMQGLDEDWVDAGTERIARYRHLRPGRFTLLVSARDPGGAWSEPDASAPIEQAPFIYQTVWFEILIVAAIAALTVLLYRLHLGAIRKRYQAVLDERTRIAREWHDTLLAGLSAATWQLGVASEQAAGGPVASSIRSAAGMVRYCRDEARRAIGELRSSEDTTPDLADSLEAAVRQLTDCSALRPRFEVEGRVPRFHNDLKTDLLRICQEAASNALQHAKASELLVRLDCNPSQLALSVQDNGVGMDVASIDAPPNGHYGLLGMRERVKRFGGELYISSSPGSGTLVKAVVPVHQ
jgi:signal transduction histidine kinase/ligand-binding sensor domain-containing protein